MYSDRFTITPQTGAASNMTFSCNGLFDPNITGAGHQPAGFDQLMILYDHYVVIGAKITVWAVNTNATKGALMVLHIHDSPGVSLDPEQLLENRYVKVSSLSGHSGGQAVAKASLKVNPNKWLGRINPLSDPSLKGDIATNPTEQCYFQISLFGIDNAFVSSVDLRCRIEYECVFIEPKRLPKS